MQTFKLTVAAAATIFCAAAAVYLFVAIWPFRNAVGLVLVIFLYVIIGCATVLAIVGTWTLAGTMFARMTRARTYANVIAVGEVVAALSADGKQWEHLSSFHEKAKAPITVQALPSPKTEQPIDEASIVEVYNQGRSVKNVAQDFQITEYRARQIINAAGKMRAKD